MCGDAGDSSGEGADAAEGVGAALVGDSGGEFYKVGRCGASGVFRWGLKRADSALSGDSSEGFYSAGAVGVDSGEELQRGGGDAALVGIEVPNFKGRR